ncbi:MAG: universal stress protein [Nitrospirales bacterium]|nr:universal stress protein [Nitrospira sp.]MDR4502531.1 universal stress protein [Nitrospirales bacterium]
MKVVCAVDGSTHSYWAVEALAMLFHQSLKEVVLLHVVDDVQLRQGMKKERASPSHMKEVITAMNHDGETLLKHAEDHAIFAINQAHTKPFVSIRTVLANGHVTNVITKQAEKRKADLIVMGSRGLSNVAGYLMGSVSRKVLMHAPCAVLTVKEKIPENPDVLLAVDGSNASKRAVRTFHSWIYPEGVSLHVLSVVPQFLAGIGPNLIAKSHAKTLLRPFQLRAREIIAHYRQFFLKDGYRVTVSVKEGEPRKVILEQLESQKANLAVLGSKGLTGPERFQMGSVSEWVSDYTSCSTLVIRPSVR